MMVQGTEAKRGRGLNYRIAGWGTAAVVLAAPLATMQVTDTVVWTAFDFALLGGLLLGAGLVVELAVRKSRSIAYRAAAGLAVLTAALLVMVSGAVGIIGAENHPANRLFVAVLAVAAAGALLARLRSAGMVRALTATAAAQAAIGVYALTLPPDGTGGPADIVIGTATFTSLWLGSAGLFWRATRAEAQG